MESTRLGLWSGLDLAIHIDGSGCLVVMETRRLEVSPGHVFHATGHQHHLDTCVLWSPSTRHGVPRDSSVMVGHLINHLFVPPCQQDCRMSDGALSDMGFIRKFTQLHGLAAKLEQPHKCLAHSLTPRPVVAVHRIKQDSKRPA